MSQDTQERIAHLERLTDDLSDIVGRQDTELRKLRAQVNLLLEREAGREAEASGGIVVGDERPPHW